MRQNYRCRKSNNDRCHVRRHVDGIAERADISGPLPHVRALCNISVARNMSKRVDLNYDGRGWPHTFLGMPRTAAVTIYTLTPTIAYRWWRPALHPVVALYFSFHVVDCLRSQYELRQILSDADFRSSVKRTRAHIRKLHVSIR